MPLSAVVLRIGGSDFYVLPAEDSADAARRLADEIRGLGGRPGGTLRLRPRTAPSHADWVDDTASAARSHDVSSTSLTGHEDPGTSWRDVMGSQVESAEAVDVERPVALWHWALATTAEGPSFEVG